MKTALGFPASLLFCLAAACGSSDATNDSGFKDPSPSSTPIVNDPGAGVLPTGGGTTGGGGAPAADLNACATSTAAAVAKPVVLVFAYDQSGSMAGSSKWTSAGAAMKSFFESSSSAGISASLTFFPKYDAGFCDTTEYTVPDVSVTSLPSPMFGAAIDATAPRPGQGGTPTVAALTGAMGYAQTLRSTSASDSSFALVMVTDGIPEVCSDKGDVGPASLVAALNSGSVPTYVVGVGDSLANLNQIAFAGGTKQAFIVSTSNPQQTQADLSAAIKTIKTSALTCDYKIPSPPSGQTLDPTKVNVQYTPTGGAAAVIAYDPTCASGVGWHYDNETSPTRVIACDTTCDSIKGDAGKVDLVFGCTTHDTKVK